MKQGTCPSLAVDTFDVDASCPWDFPLDDSVRDEVAPLFLRMAMIVPEQKVISLLLDFAQYYNLSIVADKLLLEDVLIPMQPSIRNIPRYAMDGMELPKKDGSSLFVTHRIEVALEKSLTRRVVFVEPWFYLNFLESLVRQPLINFVSQKPSFGFARALNWLFFVGANVALLSLPMRIIALVYTSLFCIKTLLILFGHYLRKHRINPAGLVGGSDGRSPGCIVASPTNCLPVLTILVPLYREAAVLPQLISSLISLRYPRELLDIKIITEANDEPTHVALRRADVPRNFHLVTVPSSLPKTKGKAMNYAARFAIGSYICVYDAENIPHPQQPLSAINGLRFYRRNRNDDIASLDNPVSILGAQCPLQWYNWGTNWLTLMMSIEYHILFKQFIPVSASLGGFIPLGGTSNFFFRSFLEGSGFWDSRNVTEDFELALRGSIAGHNAQYCPTPTEEECVVSFGAWTKQRSRWIKGFIVSLGEHFITLHARLWRRPFTLLGVYIAGWTTILQPILHVLLLFGAFNLQIAHPLLLLALLSACNIALVWPTTGPCGLGSKIITTLAFVLYSALLILPFCLALFDLAISSSHWRKTSHISPRDENC